MKIKTTLYISLILALTAVGKPQSLSPLTLDDCIEIGLEQNQSLAINRFETERSISQAKSNISLVLPNINYNLSNSNTKVGTSPGKESYNTSLTLSQNIWDGGQWWNTLKSASAAQRAAEIQMRLYELATTYQIKIAYYNYLSTSRLLNVYKENLNTSTYQHQLTQERFRLGAASQNDTLRTKVNIERSKLQIIQGENDLQDRARELNLILGREWNSPLKLVEPEWEAVQIPNLASIVDEAVQFNPQVQLLDETIEISDYNVKIARSDYIPSLGLSASYSNGSAELGLLTDNETASLSTGLSLTWNLFSGTRTKRSVEQSKISAKIAQENYDLGVRELRKNLAQTIQQLETLQESVAISQLILNAASLDLALAQEQYKVGSLSILDVLTITANYEDSKSGLIQAQNNLKIAEAGLHQLMGIR